MVRQREEHLQMVSNATSADLGSIVVVRAQTASRILGEGPVETTPPPPISEVVLKIGGQRVVLEQRQQSQTTDASSSLPPKDMGICSRQVVLVKDTVWDNETTFGGEGLATAISSSTSDLQEDLSPLKVLLEVKDEPPQEK